MPVADGAEAEALVPGNQLAEVSFSTHTFFHIFFYIFVPSFRTLETNLTLEYRSWPW